MTTDNPRPAFTDEAISDLRERLKGDLLLPDQWGYNKARTAWNLTVDQHPALIVEAECAEDVVAAVLFADAHNLKIAVQSTGHGVIYPCDRQLLIRTSEMDEIEIDADRRTARIEAGALWQDVARAASRKGLAALSGFSPVVSVTGYTLGAVFGWMLRKYGLAADSLLSAGMVTLSGEVLHITPATHPELFGALVGGGVNLGIITAIEIRLYPVKEVYTGKFYFHADDAEAVLPRYAQWAAGLPEEMTTAVNIVKFPPLPVVPLKVMGRHTIVIEGCFLGPEEEGLRLFEPIRALKPVKEELAVMSYKKLGHFNGEPSTPQKEYMEAELLEDAPHFWERFARKIARDPGAPALMFELRHVGDGALSREAHPHSVFSHRQTRFIVTCRKMMISDSSLGEAVADVQRFMADLKPYTTGHTFLNFLGHGDGISRVKAAFTTGAWDALQRLRAKYDPRSRLMSYINMPEKTG